MNLTFKQLFKFGAVCVGACALSASAADYVSDSFEAVDGGDPLITFGSENLPIGQYKQVEFGAQEVTTNWISAVGDASKLVTNNASYASIVGDGPITNDTKLLMLNLETEGTMLSRVVEDAPDYTVAPVYIDTLIQFTPSEDTPVIDAGDVKVALYVNAQSNLVVQHNAYTDPQNNNFTPYLTNSVVTSAGIIDPEKWYRLSMKVTKTTPGDKGVEIWLDGIHLTSDNAFDWVANINGGANAYLFLNIGTGLNVSYISFQGTGALDELVVSDEEPFFPVVDAGIILTLVPAAHVTFSPAGDVESGTEVTITADDWYRITDVTGPAEDLSNDYGSKVIVTTLTATVSCDVIVTAEKVSGIDSIGGSSVDLGKFATWAISNEIAEGAAVESDIDDYLLNVAPETDAVITITGIVVDKDADTTTITVGAVNPAVLFNALNGTLYVYTTADLSVEFTEKTAIDVSLTTTAAEATFVITGVSDEFIKVIVK